MSLSDGGAPMLTMPVSPTNSGGGFGWGGDNGVWLIVLFLIFAVCGGWGNNGWGGGGGAMDNYVLASDFATLQRQIDSAASTIERKSDITQQGICDGFYAMNTGMLNGFAGVTQTVTSKAASGRELCQRHTLQRPRRSTSKHTATAIFCAQWQMFRWTRRGRSWTS